MHKYVAFDLEISKQLPEDTTDLMAHRPLGISCAATLTSDGDLKLWYGSDYSDEYEAIPGEEGPDVYAQQMDKTGCQELANYLGYCRSEGYITIGWNSLGFDLDILAEECNDPEYTVGLAKLAFHHIDPFFQMVCEKGYGIGLQKAAEGMGVEGKLEGVSGADAPATWAAGRESQDKVLEYVAQDVRVTAAVYEAILAKGVLTWTSNKNKPQRWIPWQAPLDDGERLYTVAEAMEIPEPDTSWMTSPRPRSQYTGWMLDVLDTAPEDGEEPPADILLFDPDGPPEPEEPTVDELVRDLAVARAAEAKAKAKLDEANTKLTESELGKAKQVALERWDELLGVRNAADNSLRLQALNYHTDGLDAHPAAEVITKTTFRYDEGLVILDILRRVMRDMLTSAIPIEVGFETKSLADGLAQFLILDKRPFEKHLRQRDAISLPLEKLDAIQLHQLANLLDVDSVEKVEEPAVRVKSDLSAWLPESPEPTGDD